MKEFATLIWSVSEIHILTNNEIFRWKNAIAPETRYGLRLKSDYEGRLYLRAVQHRQPFMISIDKGINFYPVPSVPGEGVSISAFQCKVHTASKILTVLEGKNLWVYNVRTEQWNKGELPSDINVRDVSFDQQGGLWCVGSSDSQSIPGEETEIAIRYKASQGEDFFSARYPRPTLVAATKAISQGGMIELRTIDAESEPAVATSNCSWILDDTSSFIFIFALNVTHIKRLKGELICHIDRPKPGEVRVFTYIGNVWQGVGSSLKKHSIVAAIEKALNIHNRQILIRGIDACQEKIIIAVEITTLWAKDIAQDPEFSAVCISLDWGRSFKEQLRLNFKNEGEIQDVAWLD